MYIPPILVPIPPSWINYPTAVTYIPFFLYLRNTLIIAVVATIGELLSCSLVAYSLARIPWRGRNYPLYPDRRHADAAIPGHPDPALSSCSRTWAGWATSGR